MSKNEIIEKLAKSERKYIESFIDDRRVVDIKVDDFKFKLESMDEE